MYLTGGDEAGVCGLLCRSGACLSKDRMAINAAVMWFQREGRCCRCGSSHARVVRMMPARMLHCAMVSTHVLGGARTERRDAQSVIFMMSLCPTGHGLDVDG